MRTIWIHVDDVEWASKYLWVQHQLRGVPAVADDDEGPSSHLPLEDAGVNTDLSNSVVTDCQDEDPLQ